jgi:4'-phosphopantetheinyl transferase EntD
MISWQLASALNSTEDVSWNNLSRRVLGESTHPGRRRGFCLARSALRSLLQAQGVKIEIEELALARPHQVEKYPQFVVSLSHSPALGSAILASAQLYRAVGIDIEEQDRLVKPAILQRISHPLDALLTPLEIWCLKEAAFKALMNTGSFEHPIEFSSIQIGQKNWSRHEVTGGWEIHREQGHLIALAWIKN